MSTSERRSKSASIRRVHTQLNAQPRASPLRVLSVWSALENKYARRLDEDDIIDLRSGGLIKDRGVLRATVGKWDIGCFGDPKEGHDEGESEEHNAQLDEDEDDIDGLGSEVGLDHPFNAVHVPLRLVRDLDPNDAEDLRAFLAAEESRKAEQGVDDDVSNHEDGDSSDGSPDHHDVDEEYDMPGETEDSIAEVEAGRAIVLLSDESDDELDGYDVGEGIPSWQVGKKSRNRVAPTPVSGLRSCLDEKEGASQSRSLAEPDTSAYPAFCRQTSIFGENTSPSLEHSVRCPPEPNHSGFRSQRSVSAPPSFNLPPKSSTPVSRLSPGSLQLVKVTTTTHTSTYHYTLPPPGYPPSLFHPPNAYPNMHSQSSLSSTSYPGQGKGKRVSSTEDHHGESDADAETNSSPRKKSRSNNIAT